MDYSKWDKLELDEDDDVRGAPRVTRLEGPQRITIGGPGGLSVGGAPAKQSSAAVKRPGGALDYSKWDSLEVDDDDDEDGDYDDDDGAEEAGLAKLERHVQQQQSRHAEPAVPAPQAPETGAVPAPAVAASQSHESTLAKLTRNGAQREGYLWTQTESEVVLSVLLPAGTRARNVSLEVRRPQSLATEECARVVVALRGAPAPLLDAELAFAVELPQATEEEEAEELDWEVVDFEPAGRRLLRLTLRKQVPHGVVLWWTRALKGEEPPLDSQAFPDRRRALKPGQEDVWAEAQRMFQQRIAEREEAQQVV